MKKSIKKVLLLTATLAMFGSADAMIGGVLVKLGVGRFSELDARLQSIFEEPAGTRGGSAILRLRRDALNPGDIRGTRNRIKAIRTSEGLLDDLDHEIGLKALKDLLKTEFEKKLERRVKRLSVAKEVFISDLRIPKTRTAEKEAILEKRIRFLEALGRRSWCRGEIAALLSKYVDIDGGDVGEALFDLEWSSYVTLKRVYDSNRAETLDALESLYNTVQRGGAERAALTDDVLLDAVLGSVSPSLDYDQLGKRVYEIIRNGQLAEEQVQGLQLQLKKANVELGKAQREREIFKRKVDELNKRLMDNNQLLEEAARQYAKVAEYEREIGALRSLAPVIQLADPGAVEQLIAVGTDEGTARLLEQAQRRIEELEARATAQTEIEKPSRQLQKSGGGAQTPAEKLSLFKLLSVDPEVVQALQAAKGK